MCGILGAFNVNANLLDSLLNATNCLEHRGPDHSGHWYSENDSVFLGHRRLSILDLSAAGNQPMRSNSGRYIIVFNGEIYNHLELRAEMGSASWRGHSDTETILRGFESWGITETLRKADGMFAIGIWDSVEKNLYLTRDRIGEKPLYYGWINDKFIFSSELKSFSEIPEFNNEICKKALAFYLKHGYIPSPYSIYEKIYKVKPGHLHTLNSGTETKDQLPSQTYWSIEEKLSINNHNSEKLSEDGYIKRLDELIRASVNRQLLSDVAVGAFLSGGIDSSLIVSVMQSITSRPVNTFTIGFEDSSYNEAHHAREVANYLGTSHTELYLDEKTTLDTIPKIAEMYDEPFADPSAIPTYLVSKLAKQNVTVALSGDAGDELFGGYTRYQKALKKWKMLNNIPGSLRQLISKSDLLSVIYGDRYTSLSKAIESTNLIEYYHAMTSKTDEHIFTCQNTESYGYNNKVDLDITNIDDLTLLTYIDMLFYLPDDILVKVDRAAMANSLETRVPLLSKDILDFALTLPVGVKLRGNSGKWILKQVLSKYLPNEMFTRPKQGFGVPIKDWLKGPLKEWCNDLLSEDLIKSHGLLDYTAIKKLKEEHFSGKYNREGQLWTILMFQNWYTRKFYRNT